MGDIDQKHGAEEDDGRIVKRGFFVEVLILVDGYPLAFRALLRRSLTDAQKLAEEVVKQGYQVRIVREIWDLFASYPEDKDA